MELKLCTGAWLGLAAALAFAIAKMPAKLAGKAGSADGGGGGGVLVGAFWGFSPESMPA